MGLRRAAILDAAESVPPFLTAIFALDGRVRPFNKWLEWELREHPLSEEQWAAERLLRRLDGAIAGDAEHLRALFRDVESVARTQGFGAEIDEWEPDVPWLRGESGYRLRRIHPC